MSEEPEEAEPGVPHEPDESPPVPRPVLTPEEESGRFWESVRSKKPADLPEDAPQEPEKTPRPQSPPLTRQQEIIYFLIGFLGWWLFNLLAWSLTGGISAYMFQGLFIFPANVLTLIVLAFTQRRIALGMLAAIAVNFLITVMLGMEANAICFIPFPIK